MKSTKYHIKRIGGAHTFTYEEMATLLAKISSCLNSRPLMPMSDDPTDLLTLYSDHFITGGQIMMPAAPPLIETNIDRLKEWQKIEGLQQEFWARWQKEYILEQQRRNKWAVPSASIEVGNLVFIKDELSPPCYWLMGRIIETFPGKDGLVRSARVRTKNGELIRPVVKLCLLPFVKENDCAKLIDEKDT